ncbi:PTS sugar transporter subunit IIA [Fusobacterium mortiferum]|uniref:PTS sugar transporter subunit IIA n=1 Tax=Fusobacterium mortiferum TaxID=850 RepID=UPI00158CC61D|nr:PTS sugar transporter subunit IIA [Fusobacterium mortiferum]
MLKDFLKGNITLKERVVDWQEAVKIAAQKLLEKGNIEENYIEKMIGNINKLGPYIVLADDVAMPHSRPEDGVNKTGISLLKLNEGVSFGEETSVRLIFILAAQDSNSHIEMITELVDMLQDEEKLFNILQSKTEDEIIKILK